MEDFCFKKIGEFNTSGFIEKMQTISDEEWHEYEFRQKTWDIHKQTLTIPILFNENFGYEPIQCKHYPLFEQEVLKLEQYFKSIYGRGKFIRIILVNLVAGGKISVHVDGGPGYSSLELGNRHHLPIITNDNVIFYIGGEERNLKVNEVWEINNQKPHGVFNNSDEDRIHMIADWYVGI
jgi:hypothetical protein